MENTRAHCKITESQDGMEHDIEVVPNVVDTNNVVANNDLHSPPDTLREMVNSIQLQDSPTSMQDMKKSFELVVATLMTAIKSLEKLKIDVTDIRKSSSIIQTSVKMLEMVVCSTDDNDKITSVAQKKKEPLNPEGATMGEVEYVIPLDTNDARNKRKMFDDEKLQLFDNDILTLSDDDNEDA